MYVHEAMRYYTLWPIYFQVLKRRFAYYVGEECSDVRVGEAFLGCSVVDVTPGTGKGGSRIPGTSLYAGCGGGWLIIFGMSTGGSLLSVGNRCWASPSSAEPEAGGRPSSGHSSWSWRWAWFGGRE